MDPMLLSQADVTLIGYALAFLRLHVNGEAVSDETLDGCPEAEDNIFDDLCDLFDDGMHCPCCGKRHDEADCDGGRCSCGHSLACTPLPADRPIWAVPAPTMQQLLQPFRLDLVRRIVWLMNQLGRWVPEADGQTLTTLDLHSLRATITFPAERDGVDGLLELQGATSRKEDDLTLLGTWSLCGTNDVANGPSEQAPDDIPTMVLLQLHARLLELHEADKAAALAELARGESSV